MFDAHGVKAHPLPPADPVPPPCEASLAALWHLCEVSLWPSDGMCPDAFGGGAHAALRCAAMSRFRSTHSADTMRAFWRDTVRAFGDTSGQPLCAAGRPGHLLRRALPGARADLPQARLRAAGLPRSVQHDDRHPTASPCLPSGAICGPATLHRSGQVALGCGPCGHCTPPVVRARARTSRAQTRITRVRARVCVRPACVRNHVCAVSNPHHPRPARPDPVPRSIGSAGPAHWELLMRSRALDNQVYVAAVSPARNESGTYHAWGHSSFISVRRGSATNAQRAPTR